MNKNDKDLDNFYSNSFKAICYSKETIPEDHLPYGLISDHNKYKDKYTDISKDDWLKEVYKDCLKYINDTKDSNPEEWNNDFIVFTNLQIIFYNKCGIVGNDDEFELLVDYTSKQIRNLRSYVARNAHLFVECLIDCLDDEELFTCFCHKIILHLLACTGSEKSIYRESSKSNLKKLVNRCSKNFNEELLWTLLVETQNKNKKISSSAGDFTLVYLLGSNKNDLESLDIPRFVECVESSLNGRNIDVKSCMKRLVSRLPEILSEFKLKEFIRESENIKSIKDIIKKEFPPNL